MKYVEEWIREEIEYNNKMYDQAPIERERIRKETDERLIKQYGEMGETKLCMMRFRDTQYNNELKRWHYWLGYRQYGSKVAHEKMEKDVRKHFDTLQAKVEAKIGKIIKIVQINGNIYAFEGELDNCNVEVILAGGYNIQRLHTRWIITKNINR